LGTNRIRRHLVEIRVAEMAVEMAEGRVEVAAAAHQAANGIGY
jgi:hypothetical protein